MAIVSSSRPYTKPGSFLLSGGTTLKVIAPSTITTVACGVVKDFFVFNFKKISRDRGGIEHFAHGIGDIV
jgi:hypothetical protein